ncbi:MAG: pyridoxal 5'-phosphate synthase glutaminase subunit PdxT [Clostridiales bacterium]|jgi:5'-phosphate synthase pdxT subunit|nr:pyridoxal 5'-phosphate synthase glutaminase subunit PdxT [Clostridiales bacterium]
MKIGVLALQGAFFEHRAALGRLGVESFEIRSLTDWQPKMDGLIIPGGESTVIGKLLTELRLLEPMRHSIRSGLAVFGTCAGLILLSKRIEDYGCGPLGVLGAVTRRNAYGRQLGSFRHTGDFMGVGTVEMVFIRAPYVVEVEEGVDVLAEVDGKITAIREGNVLATAFHPELTADLRIHSYFLSIAQQRQAVLRSSAPGEMQKAAYLAQFKECL